MKLVILITAQTEQSLQIATAWQTVGATGVTIVEGYGFRRLQEKFALRGDLPLLPSLETLLRGQEVNTHLLISAVTDEVAPKLTVEAEKVLGDLALPDNGLLLVLDIATIVGLRGV